MSSDACSSYLVDGKSALDEGMGEERRDVTKA
jgi:hypothetical protein